MNTYTITIIGNGDPADAKAIAQVCASSLVGEGHKVMQAIINIDRNGQYDLITEEAAQAARDTLAAEIATVDAAVLES